MLDLDGSIPSHPVLDTMDMLDTADPPSPGFLLVGPRKEGFRTPTGICRYNYEYIVHPIPPPLAPIVRTG